MSLSPPRSPVALVSSLEVNAEIDFDALAEAFNLARTRTRTRSPDTDLAFAVSQMVDVGAFALQARSDTSTAHGVLVHLEAVLEEIVARGLPRLHDKDKDGRWVYDDLCWDAADIVKLCAERIRGRASQDPESARHLMHMLQRVRELAKGCEASAVVSEAEYQAEMLRTFADASGTPLRNRQQRG